jgi:hypothetical protein
MKRYCGLVAGMRFDKLLISLAIFVFSICSSHGMDILSPSQLGESMDMPLPQDLLQKGVSAGIIKSTSQITEPLPSGHSGVNLGLPVTPSDPPGDPGTHLMAEKELNVSGTLSLVLQNKTVNYMNLELHQSIDSVLGRGNMTSDNSVQNITASGQVEDGKLSLKIALDGSSELCSLQLQPEGNMLKGSYNVHTADGVTLSGTAVGILSNGAVKPQSPQDLLPKSSAISETKPLSSSTTGGAGPIQLGQGSRIGSTFSSSKSISMSTSSGGSMVSSTSSSSF